jgi:GNAT superfamily N-acetyltransferase
MHRVRRATLSDLNVLVGFSLALCRETEGRELDRDVVQAGILAALNNPDWVILVAEDDSGHVVGEIMVGGREWYDWSNGQFWWVTSVYVHPKSRRTGVGRALYTGVRQIANTATPRVVGIRGCVRQDNTDAQGALNKLGRRFNGQLVFEERFGDTPVSP